MRSTRSRRVFGTTIPPTVNRVMPSKRERANERAVERASDVLSATVAIVNCAQRGFGFAADDSQF